MKTADLAAGPQTDALVALAQELPLSSEFNQDDHILVGVGDGDLYRYSPSSTPAQWAELIEVFPMVYGARIEPGKHKAQCLEGFVVELSDSATAGLAICKAVIAAKWGDTIPDEIWEKVA